MNTRFHLVSEACSLVFLRPPVQSYDRSNHLAAVAELIFP
jgi:hypothetical protein